MKHLIYILLFLFSLPALAQKKVTLYVAVSGVDSVTYANDTVYVKYKSGTTVKYEIVAGSTGITALTGDVTASGTGSVAATLATVNSNVGSFTNANITVNAKGLITAASNGSGGGMTNPMTTSNDIIYSSDNSGTPARLGIGTNKYFLQSNGASTAPSWESQNLLFDATSKSYYTFSTSGFGSQSDARNIAIGDSAGYAFNKEQVMVAFGYRALRTASNVNGYASGSVAIGNNALRLYNPGSFIPSIAIGSGALENSTNPGATSANIAIGPSAANRLVTARGIIAIGQGAANTSGPTNMYENIVIGNNSFAAMTNAANVYDNVIIGSNSWTDNVDGGNFRVYNVGIGSANGVLQKNGTYNTFVGYAAGSLNASVATTHNTAIGAQAGTRISGYWNTDLGSQAGWDASRTTQNAGNGNVRIGYRNGGTSTAGDNNVGIGYNINMPSTTASNQLVIGGNTIRWITRFTSGNFQLNTTTSNVGETSSAHLEVNGTTGGFLPPRLTTTQMNAIASPAAGLQVYNTTENAMMYYDGTRWTGFRWNGTKYQGYNSVDNVWTDLN